MEQVIYQLSSLLPYFIIFPVLALILALIFNFLSKREITNKNATFYGLFMNLRTIDIISISLLIMHYFLIIESFFITENSIYTFLLLMIPIVIFNILNFNLIKVVPSIMNSLLVYVLLFFKTIFYSYMIEIQPTWYVILLFAVVIVFILIYSTFVFLNDLLSVLKHDEYVKKKIKGAKN